VQIPLTFASQFVMFLVMGIGLDGVFLMLDTFDHAPVRPRVCVAPPCFIALMYGCGWR
jgi:hypothetical protein